MYAFLPLLSITLVLSSSWISEQSLFLYLIRPKTRTASDGIGRPCGQGSQQTQPTSNKPLFILLFLGRIMRALPCCWSAQSVVGLEISPASVVTVQQRPPFISCLCVINHQGGGGEAAAVCKDKQRISFLGAKTLSFAVGQPALWAW